MVASWRVKMATSFVLIFFLLLDLDRIYSLAA